jgi:hypothetical protein
MDVLGLSASASSVFPIHTHTCAVLSTGFLSCWGNNSYGQLGLGTTSSSEMTPVDVTFSCP